MANYPTADPSFGNKANGNTIDASHINALQDEVVAIGAALRGGLAHALTVSTGGFTVSTGNTVLGQNLSVAGNSTFASTVNFTGTIKLSGSSGSTAQFLRGDMTWSTVTVSASKLAAFDDTQDTSAGDPEEVLFSHTVPANTLDTNGKTVKLTAVGTLAADTDAKIVRVRWGGLAGTIACTVSNNSASDVNWRVEVLVARIGSNSQRLTGVGHFFTTTAASRSVLTITTATETDSGGVDLVVTADGVNAGDIVFEAAWVEYLLP